PHSGVSSNGLLASQAASIDTTGIWAQKPSQRHNRRNRSSPNGFPDENKLRLNGSDLYGLLRPIPSPCLGIARQPAGLRSFKTGYAVDLAASTEEFRLDCS